MANDALDAEEGLSILLGGLSVSDLAATEWVEWNDEPDEVDSALLPVEVGDDPNEGIGAATKPASPSTHRMEDIPSSESTTWQSNSPHPPLHVSSSYTDENDPDVTFRRCYQRAFHVTSDGRCCRPPVRIVDMAHVNNRGFALVSSRPIRRGEVIYTEQALQACQMPVQCRICRAYRDSKDIGKELELDNGDAKNNTPEADRKVYMVRGCQHCFKSLEPASSILCQKAVSESFTLPMAHLWPVPDYNSDIDREDRRTGRVRCRKCHATFCSNQCCESHTEMMGDCCLCTSSIQHVAHATCCLEGTGSAEDGVGEISVQPPLVLAARMFCAEVQRHRLERRNGKDYDDISPYHGLCGDVQDVTPLELGVVGRNSLHSGSEASKHDAISYTLEGAHAALCDALSLTPEERMNAFPLSFLHRLAAVAARNGFHVTTQSPFRTYYSGLLRASGGRGSTNHKRLVEELARALGSPDGKLQRDMDRKVEEKCAVDIAALFTLTARINHSCNPCAEIRGGEFVDCYIDLVARRDIDVGEEITISYINLGKTAGRAATDRNKRRRELKARYLFDCDCPLCQS